MDRDYSVKRKLRNASFCPVSSLHFSMGLTLPQLSESKFTGF